MAGVTLAALLAACSAGGNGNDDGSGPTEESTATEAAGSAPVAFPLTVSEDGRHLVDQEGVPFLYTADTAWTMLGALSVPDAQRLLDMRVEQGFNAVQSILTSFTPTDAGPRGAPFVDGNLTRPNEDYWRGVDEILRHAEQHGVVVYAVPLWMANNGGWACEFGPCAPVPSEDAVRTYMTWVGERYRETPNLIWVIGGDDEVDRNREVKLAGARALHDADPDRLMTYHPRYAEYGFAGEDWYSLYAFQKNDITPPYAYQQVREARELSPTRPVLDAEPPYEPTTAIQQGEVVTPALNRRFGWWAVLSGAMGVVYGGPRGTWSIGAEGPPDWSLIERSQARDTATIRRILGPLAWQDLRPDWDGEVVTGGRGTYGGDDWAPAGLSEDGSLLVAYAPSARELTVDTDRLAGPSTLTWYDPSTGEAGAPPQPVEPDGALTVATPGPNASGDDDWVLIVTR